MEVYSIVCKIFNHIGVFDINSCNNIILYIFCSMDESMSK